MVIKTEDKDLEELLRNMIAKLGSKVVPYDVLKEENNSQKIDLLILDTRETKEDEIVSFINSLKKVNSLLEIMVLTCCKHNIKSSIIAMKSGASDELLFPIEIEKLEEKIKNILEKLARKKN